jgi:hypothetical protein
VGFSFFADVCNARRAYEITIPPVPTTEPTQVYAGDTVKWTKSLVNYPASDGWTLNYSIRGTIEYDLAATTDADGQTYDITIPAADSAKWKAGDNIWQSYVTKGSETYTIDHGALKILPALAKQVATFAFQSTYKQALANAEAQLLKLTNVDWDSMSAEGRSIAKRRIDEQRELILWLKAEVVREECEDNRSRGRGNRRRILARFSPQTINFDFDISATS